MHRYNVTIQKSLVVGHASAHNGKISYTFTSAIKIRVLQLSRDHRYKQQGWEVNTPACSYTCAHLISTTAIYSL